MEASNALDASVLMEDVKRIEHMLKFLEAPWAPPVQF